jgi:hypothetical protein
MNLTDNDKHLLKQMINAGKFNYDIYELLIEYNKDRAKEMIQQMGTKWCLHPLNATKRLDTPLPLLNRGSRILMEKRETTKWSI